MADLASLKTSLPVLGSRLVILDGATLDRRSDIGGLTSILPDLQPGPLWWYIGLLYYWLEAASAPLFAELISLAIPLNIAPKSKPVKR